MNKDIRLTLLERAQVASPCSARWEDMRGDDTTRFCEQCSLHVHDLTAMSNAEAESLLRRHFAPDGTPIAGGLCGRLFRRPDGTVLEQDCPVGLARIRATARKSLARIAAAVGLLTGIGAALAWTQQEGFDGTVRGSLRGLEPIATLSRWMAPRSLPPLAARQPMILGGAIACPPPAPPAPTPSRNGRK